MLEVVVGVVVVAVPEQTVEAVFAAAAAAVVMRTARGVGGDLMEAARISRFAGHCNVCGHPAHASVAHARRRVVCELEA